MRHQSRFARATSVRLPALLFLALAGCATEPPATGDILLIVIDTCRRDAISVYGGPAGNTPNLDAFAERYTRFDRAIATSSWTLPSVGSVLTSRVPTVHGAYGLGKDLTRLRGEIPTGPEELAARGWGTSAVVNAPFLRPELGMDRGFATYDFFRRSRDTERRAGPSVDAALAQLEASPDRRDFVLLHVFDPHLPYDPPAEFAARAREGYDGELELPLRLLKRMRSGNWDPTPEDRAYIRRVYDAEVSYVDRELGRLFRELQASGLWEGATVVVTSDHGEELGDHGGWEHGHAMWDELVRVPLLVKLPGSAGPVRSVVPEQVSLLGLMPTLFEAAGEPAPEWFEGESFLSLILESGESREAFSERVHLGSEEFSLRDASHTWIWNDKNSTGELYDWDRDPGELENLTDQAPETAVRLRERLLDRIAAAEVEANRLSPREGIEPSGELVEQLQSLGYAGD